MAITTATKLIRPTFKNIPAELKALPQWVLWNVQSVKKKTKNPDTDKFVWEEVKNAAGEVQLTKLPIQINGKSAKSTDPSTWSTFDKVAAAYESGQDRYDGIGFVLSESDPYACVDIDGVDMDNLPEHAKKLIGISYTELSPSGGGFHVWVQYEHNRKTHKNKNVTQGVEVYSNKRYMTFTGEVTHDLPINGGEEIAALVEHYLPKEEVKEKKTKPVSTKNERKIDSTDQITDIELEDFGVLNRMLNSKNAAKIKALYNGDTSAYADDDSSADLALCNHLAYFTNGNAQQMDRIFRQSKLYRDKWERDDYRDNTIHEAIEGYESLKAKKEMQSRDPLQQFMPHGFSVNGGYLMSVKKEGEAPSLLCRTVPILKKRFVDVETNMESYELYWKDSFEERTEIVSSGAIAESRKMLDLREQGFPVTGNTARYLIDYFEKFQSLNDVPVERSVSRIGHIKGKLIHPLLDQGVAIESLSAGERQLKEAFQEKGTLLDWKTNVLDVVKPYPKVLFLIASSFASVTLHEYDIPPFIVDISGNTSQGKSTALAAAASVWGVPSLQGYMQSFNGTVVSFERKSSYLNSYPFIVDDSRNGDTRTYQDLIYKFSSGRGKGRGALKGAQQEATWKQIMITSGESRLANYTNNAGGVEARIVHLEDEPFPNAPGNFLAGFNTFNLKQAYGVAGKEFVEHLIKRTPEQKKQHMERLLKLQENYSNEAKDNIVLKRLSLYYATIHHTITLLNEWLQLDIDPSFCAKLFKEDQEINTGTDKPLEILEELLDYLSSHKHTVDRGESDSPPHLTNAFVKDKVLHFLTAFLKDKLGPEMKTIRREWLKSGYTLEGSSKDTRVVRFRGETTRCIAVNPDMLKKLGISFRKETVVEKAARAFENHGDQNDDFLE